MPPAMEIETGLSAGLQVLNLNSNVRRISKHGRFEGTNPEHVNRCISLLEHTGTCRTLSSCTEGGGCYRTKQVLFHHFKCLKFSQSEECSICDQLIALCQLHSEQCKNLELGCTVPHCRNNKHRQLWVKQEPNTPNNRNTDPTNEEYIQMVRKLRQALRTSSVEEKQRNILQILNSNPKTTVKLFKDLCKIKRTKLGRDQVVPINNCSRQSVRAALPSARLTTVSNDQKSAALDYRASFRIMPI